MENYKQKMLKEIYLEDISTSNNNSTILSNWRYAFFKDFLNKDLVILKGDFYEFGVFWGLSLAIISCLYGDKIINANGFDSWIGLPEEKNDDYNPEYWTEGFLSCVDGANKRADINNVEDVKNWILKNWNFNITNPNLKVNLIDGFYKDSLKNSLIDKFNFNKASIVDFDCDQYTSTFECWEFLINNKLLQEKTLLLYDDWGCHGGNFKEFLGGQSKVHKEFTEKYNIECIELYDSNYGQKVFQIKNIPDYNL